MEIYQLAQSKLAREHITLEIDEYDRKLLAKQPAAVFVCNHLLPGMDEWMLLALLSEQFENVRILHPYHNPPPRDMRALALLPERRQLDEHLWRVNFAKRLVRQVRKGAAVGLVIDFSENLLGNFGKNLLRAQILKQLRKCRLPIVPIHLDAERVPGGLLRKTVPGWPLYPHDEPMHVCVRVGNAIQPEDVALFKKTRPWSQFLQAKIFSLGSSFEIHPQLFTGNNGQDNQDLAEPVDPAILEKEIAALPPDCHVTTRGQFDVYVAPFSALPNTMFEIGRLRELTFRAAGEGTGRPRDLDEYDLYYLQLIIWDKQERRIVGGYRLGQGDRIFRRFGVNGFYTSSLFKFEPGFYPILQHTVELGRSYVTPDYQRHRLPLFLLWKGIYHFMSNNPQYRYLCGPVSISKYYSEASKAVIVEFVRRYFFDHQLAQFVEPRKPFRFKAKQVNAKLLAETFQGEFDALETFVENIEPAHFSVPVLFRQYLKQNARFIAFNVDPLFSDCLDGLMVLDYQNLPAGTVEMMK